LLDRRARVVAARGTPVLIIVGLDLRVLGWSPNSGAQRVIADAGPDLKEAIERSFHSRRQIIHVMNDDILLRIAPLESQSVPCVVMFIESFGHRSSLAEAAKTHRLTKRETEILGFVIQGLSNAEIADELYIAHSTVADHIKSLMRKTQTTRRIHLLSKVGYGNLRNN